MQFMIVWNTSCDNRKKAFERNLATGARPPEGIKMINRWHVASQGKGFVLAETDDPVLMAKWAMEWCDLMDFESYLVIDESVYAKLMQP